MRSSPVLPARLVPTREIPESRMKPRDDASSRDDFHCQREAQGQASIQYQGTCKLRWRFRKICCDAPPGAATTLPEAIPREERPSGSLFLYKYIKTRRCASLPDRGSARRAPRRPYALLGPRRGPPTANAALRSQRGHRARLREPRRRFACGRPSDGLRHGHRDKSAADFTDELPYRQPPRLPQTGHSTSSNSPYQTPPQRLHQCPLR